MAEYKKIEHNLLTISGGIELKLNEFIYKAEKQGKKIYIQSGLHGGETSQWVLYKLHKFLMQNLRAGEIHIVPYANPLGWLQRTYYSTFGKFSLLDGQDYNRCFTDTNKQDTNSILCKKICELASNSDFALDLHTSKNSNPFAIYTNNSYISYIKALGFKYNQYSDDASIPALYGTFNACLDRHHVPNVTIECGGHDEYCEYKINEVYNAIINLLGKLEVLTTKQANENDVFRFEKRNKIYAASAGLIKFEKEIGDTVEQGDVIARLYPSDDISCTEIILAKENGIIHVINPSHIVWQGDIIAEIIPQQDLVLL